MDDVRQIFWESNDGRLKMIGGETEYCGWPSDNWQLWYDDHPVIAGNFSCVTKYLEAEFL